MRTLILGLAALAVCSLTATAQDNNPHVVKAATTKYMKLPVIPQCMDIAAQEGDPTKGAATILVKMPAGCVVPWHWHTATERLMIVSGRGKVEMKDHGADAVAAGDYVYLTAKGVHQFTCTAACQFFLVTDGAFDIHYVKPDGGEIPPEEALKAAPTAKKTKPAAEKK